MDNMSKENASEQVERLAKENMTLKVLVNLLKNKLTAEDIRAIEREAEDLTK